MMALLRFLGLIGVNARYNARLRQTELDKAIMDLIVFEIQLDGYKAHRDSLQKRIKRLQTEIALHQRATVQFNIAHYYKGMANPFAGYRVAHGRESEMIEFIEQRAPYSDEDILRLEAAGVIIPSVPDVKPVPKGYSVTTGRYPEYLKCSAAGTSALAMEKLGILYLTAKNN